MPQRVVTTTDSFAHQLIQLSRPFNSLHPLLLIVAGYVIAGGSVLEPSASLSWLIISLLLLHSGVTVANDVVDSAVDRDNHVETPLTTGSAAVRQRFHYAAWALTVAALVVSLLILPLTTTAIIAAIALIGVIYNYPPLQLSRRPLGSIVALGLSYGFLPILAGFSLLETPPSPLLWLIGSFYLLARIALSLLKDFKDVAGDTKHHKQTFLLRYGMPATLRISHTLALIGLLGIITTVTVYAAGSSPLIATGAFVMLGSLGGHIMRLRKQLGSRAAGTTVTPVFDRLLLAQGLFDLGIILWLTLL